MVSLAVNEVQAEKRNQKTVRPATVGQPSADNLADFNAKQIADQSSDDEYLDVTMRPELAPRMRSKRHCNGLCSILHIGIFSTSYY